MNRDNENIFNSVEQKLRAITPSSNPFEPLVLIDCGDFSLLIPSNDIVTLMPTQKIIASSGAQTCGAIEFYQKIIPVFAFNKALQLQSSFPAESMTLVVIQYQSHLFAISCNSFEKIEMADLHFYSVPLSMSSRKQPFTQFTVVNKRAAGLSSGEGLWQLLTLRNAVHAVPMTIPPTLIQGAGQ